MCSNPAIRAPLFPPSHFTGATSLSFGNDLGSIESGKLTGIVVLNSDPLRDLHNTIDIEYVMTNGFLYDASTMDRVWPSKEPLGEFYWQRSGTDLKTLPRP